MLTGEGVAQFCRIGLKEPASTLYAKFTDIVDKVCYNLFNGLR
jgi:hypothetical protein